MPQKLNKAGKMQDYIPAGNGDPSGEYGNASGSNKDYQPKKTQPNVISDNKSVAIEKKPNAYKSKAQSKYVDYIKEKLKIDLSKYRDEEFDNRNGFNIDTKNMSPYDVNRLKSLALKDDKFDVMILDNGATRKYIRVKEKPNVINDNLTAKKSDKERQLEIITKNNPMLDDYHVGIRKLEDIKTFEEAMRDDESFIYGDYDIEDAKRDLKRGKVMVYSSKPFSDGGFVSTSKNMAQDYAGNGKVYSQEFNIKDIAWISGDEGQIARLK